MSRIWKELNVSPEEQKLAEEIINSGAGKTLGQEALNQFHVRKEWNMEIETSVGKTLVHMYQDQPETKKSALFINVPRRWVYQRTERSGYRVLQKLWKQKRMYHSRH